jgi:hypothetical protein
MAKPTTKAKKAKKTKLPRKPQPLPRSVQALLKYLGGSDVKLGGARGGQPATLAPTSINIAVSQQQQQQQAQAQQSVRARVAPKGQVVGQSPLAGVIPQAPVIVQQAPTSTAETERKIQEQAKQAEVKQDELNRKFGLLEASQQQFRQAAATAYQDIKQDINRRVAGDANIFDARNIAARFASTPRPVVEEQQFAGMSFGGGAAAGKPVGTFGGIEVTEVFKGARQEETAPGLAEHLAGQYIKNVSNPEMTEIKRPGRPRKSEAEKAATKAAAAARKKASKPTAAEATSSASLLEQRAPATIAGFTAVPEQGYMLKEPARRTILVKKKPVSTTGAPDMATQIALLTGGGAARPPQSQGQNIADLLGAKKK